MTQAEQTISRQVRRAAERLARKAARPGYPKGLMANGMPIQRQQPFKPKGKTWPEPGKREATKRLIRAGAML